VKVKLVNASLTVEDIQAVCASNIAARNSRMGSSSAFSSRLTLNKKEN
jgi:hypothetical protein